MKKRIQKNVCLKLIKDKYRFVKRSLRFVNQNRKYETKIPIWREGSKLSMRGLKWMMKKGKDASSLVESGLELAPFHRYLSLL